MSNKDRTEESKFISNVFPKSENQKEYLKSIYENQITFAIGLAGTGKTLLALKAALDMLYNPDGNIRNILIIRPLVPNTFGEKIGALPGNAYEKSIPFLGSILDNLKTLIEQKEITRLLEKKIIDTIPLSLIRGRSFNNTFIICEEMQNTIFGTEAIYTLLTRLGKNSKMVINGDPSQNDLKPHEESDLVNSLKIISTPSIINGVGIIYLNDKMDVQRNPILYSIMERFGKVTNNIDPFN